MAGAVRVDLVRTNGIFSLDGEDFEVENNVWLVGDDEQVLVVDAAHDAAPIVKAVGGRRVVLIVSTHGHNDHINAADALAEITGAPVALHPDDDELWAAVYRRRRPDRTLADSEHIPVGDHRLVVLHTPGHSPGGVCLYDPGPGNDPGQSSQPRRVVNAERPGVNPCYLNDGISEAEDHEGDVLDSAALGLQFELLFVRDLILQHRLEPGLV